MTAALATEEHESGVDSGAVEVAVTGGGDEPRKRRYGWRAWLPAGVLILVVAGGVLLLLLLVLAGGESESERMGEGHQDASTPTSAGEADLHVSVEALHPASSQGLEGVQVMHGLLETGGVYLAVGQQTLDPDEDDAAVWQSTDGREWVAVRTATLDGVPGFQSMYGLIDVGGSFIAVGADDRGGSSDAAVWQSTDGHEWIRQNRAELWGVEGRQAMLDVVRVGDLLVAVGVDDSADGLGDGAVWTSVDGTSWTRVAEGDLSGVPGRQEMFAVAVVGDRLLAAGSSADAGSGASDAAIWESTDGGKRWGRVEASGLAGSDGTQIMQGLADLDGLLVATGVDDRNDADGDAAVWISQDAVEWRAVAVDELSSVPGRQEMFGLISTAEGGFAGGSSESDLGLWYLELDQP
ncbi:MAG: hypothetical protein JJLCMIEE_01839 [Acidimicrobiales bacterium]|nr:hypothetical protein [Acidimicrobiales bacterium]